MQPFPRPDQLLAPMSRSARVGAALTACIWASIWVGAFFVVGDAVVLALELVGTPRTVVGVGLPTLAALGWLALLIRAGRNHARRRRLLRQEFIEPPPPASRPDAA